MTLPTSTLRRLLVVGLLPFLAACGGLLSSPPERQLYRVTPAFAFPPGLPPVSAQLLIAAPTAPAGLDTRRIALSRSPVTIEYYAGVEWTDRVPFLVQDALVEGFQKSGAVPKVAADRGGLHADYVFDIAVDDFAAAYDSPDGPPLVRVALNAKLVRMPERSIVAHKDIRREQRAAANAMPDIIHAFDSALSAAVQDLVLWTVGNPVLSARPRSAR